MSTILLLVAAPIAFLGVIDVLFFKGLIGVWISSFIHKE